MPNATKEQGRYLIQTVQPEHIESIRVWRNKQMDVLRQAAPISEKEQVRYYEQHIWPTLTKENPTNILVSYLENEQLVGYGGLVHISWPDSAEVSFLLNPDLIVEPETYRRYHLNFLELTKRLAFDDLGFHTLTTETYAHRVAHIANLEAAGFRPVEVIANAVLIDNVATDAIMHRCLRSEEPTQ
jgi:RimJ/RimL family protein N-acetyltransferase